MRQERNIVRLVSSGRCTTATEAQRCLKSEYNFDISAQSIRRALKRNGLQSRVRRKKPLLRVRHRQRRLAFARKYKDWPVEKWERVVWSDENKFNVSGSDGRQYCWKKRGESIQDHHIAPTVKHGGGSVIVWGCMASHGVGFLCRIDGGLDAEL